MLDETFKDQYLLPADALPLILYQRSEYQSNARKLLRNIARKISLLTQFDKTYNRRVVTNDAEVKRISKLYMSDMYQIYSDISDFLPKTVENILDIGCGMGGIDLFLYKHYQQEVKIHLLDSHCVDDTINIGFHSNAVDFSFYNDFQLSTDYLSGNGVSIDDINTINIKTQDFPSEHKFELIVSLLSWGFHYPLATYLGEVFDCLADDGVLILDIRDGTEGLIELSDVFGCEPLVIRKMTGYSTVMVSKK